MKNSGTIKTNRRAILAGALSLPALALPTSAGAAGPDPVYAAIERYRETRRALAEDAARFPGRDVDENLIDDEIEAVDAMLRTKPTTVAGCVALLREAATAAEDMNCTFFANIRGLGEAGAGLLPMLAAFIEGAASDAKAVQS